jgi:FkbM family methyltransferase
VQKAIGSIDGGVLLYLSTGKSEDGFIYDCASSIRKPKDVNKDFPLVKFERDPVSVQCVRLDSFCREVDIQEIDLLFADIQGAEKDLIIGAGEMLKKIKFIYLEKSNTTEWYEGQWLVDDLKKYLSEQGFAVFKDFTFDILFYNTNYLTF